MNRTRHALCPLLMQDIAKRYRNRVQQERLKAAIKTQTELARLSGIHQVIISRLERQDFFLSAPYALRLAEVLRCQVNDLYERVSSSHTGGCPCPSCMPVEHE